MITPLLDYVVLREIKTAVGNEIGIIVPDSADIPYSIKGEVLALGENVTMPLKIGDKVLFHRFGFQEITYDKEPYLVGKQENIYAKC